MEVLLSVLQHRTPCQRLTEHALEAVLSQPRLTSSAGAASFALQTVSQILRQRCPHLYDTPAVRVLLCQALLSDRLFSDAMGVLEGMPDAWITPGLWAAVMEAAGEGKIAQSQLLWRLLTLAPQQAPGESRVVQTGRRIPAEVMGEEEPAEAVGVGVGSATGRVKESCGNSNRGRRRQHQRTGSIGDDTVMLTTFEVRPASLARLTQDSERLEWCRLGTAEVGFAEQHYQTLRDQRAWGSGTMHVEGDSTTEGIVFGLDARLASRLMLRANVSFSGQASPLIALQILRRYLRTCHALREQAATIADEKLLEAKSRATANSQLSSSEALVKRDADSGAVEGAEVHPSPFLLFFKIVRETRDVVAGGNDAPAAVYGQLQPSVPHSGLPMIHWGVVWRLFQTLNRECPTWYNIIPEEAGDLSEYVIDVLCRGADPWMTLNVARAVSSRHIIDGLDMSLWLLHRLDASHHTEEAREVTKKVFRWLLVDVGVHLLPQLHHHLVPASRVLIRLGLQEELRQFYNAVLENVYAFTEGFRADFMQVMNDLVCPSCSSILPEQDVFVERVCPLCLTVVPPKDPNALPSFQLSSEHVARLREKRKALRLKNRQRLHERIHRWSKQRDDKHDTGSPHEASAAASSAAFARPPLDAGTVFKREILGDTVPLIPGVAVNMEVPLFLFDGNDGTATKSSNIRKDGDGTDAPFDVHAAMEESSRRLQLQEAARRYILAQRGASPSSWNLAAPPSLLSSASPHRSTTQQDRQQPLLLSYIRVDGPWTCVWCQEHNSEWSSRVQCAACGAETGPSAPWRHFVYTDSGDVMTEIRTRVANAEARPIDAIVAAYLLMVYRRAFLLRATPHDHERIDQLIRRLCALHERVLAGYLYMRLVPAQARQKNETLFALAQLFGGSEAACVGLTAQDLAYDEDKFFHAVFTPATCKVCFGVHAWKACPIITRDFSTTTRTSINMTPEEKQRAVLQQLRLIVETAVQRGAENSRLVVDAYTAFVKSPYRELFAEVHSRDVNRLSVLLSNYRQYRRAAFVLCHVPLHLRNDEAYLVMVHYFNVPIEEARDLLRKRSPLGVEDESHPNFVQVVLTCCMCLDERHASFECPRLTQWLSEVDARTFTGGTSGPAATALSDPLREQQQAKRLRAQVDGWTSAGPERLHAFYRFLLQRVDTFEEGIRTDVDDDTGDAEEVVVGAAEAATTTGHRPRRRIDVDDPIVYAINKTITKLASVGQVKFAYRLYARTPVAFISRHTTSAMLRMNRFSDDGIYTLLNSDGSGASSSSTSSLLDDTMALGMSSEAARAAAVPMRSHCLLCFDNSHAYFDCPELAAQPTTAAKLEYVAVHVGGIRCCVDGIRAAAAFAYHAYNLGNLTSELLRAHPSLVRALLRLVRRCFASGHVAAGVRVLRRLPTEMVPPARVYTELWRAAGLPATVLAERSAQLLALYAAEGLAPRIDDPPARQTYSNRFLTGLAHALHDDLCRHCYQHGHTLATCGVFHAEVSFGRDYVAAYRMSMMSEQLDRDWQDAYLLKLVDFFQSHRLFMPYHIVGVTNALNAIAAMWSFRGEPGIAMRHLLNIPPAYRRRQAFKHILHALQIPTAEITQTLANVYFSPDEVVPSSGRRQIEAAVMNSSSSSSSSSGGVGGGVVAQHLLMPKPAIRDVAMTAVFNHFPAALAALEKSEERMSTIRRRNTTQRVTGDTTKASVRSASSTATPTTTTAAAASSALQVMQSGDILTLREDFDPVLTELELAVGMKLGSRHVLFTSAVDILSAAANNSDNTTNAGENDTAASSVATSSSSSSTAAAAAATAQAAVKEKTETSNQSRGPKVPDEDTVVTFFTNETKRDRNDNRSSSRSSSSRAPPTQTGRRETFGNSPSRHQKSHQHYSQRPRYHERQQRQQQRGQRGGGGNSSSRSHRQTS